SSIGSMSARQFSITASASICLSMIAPFIQPSPWPPLKAIIFFWIANVNLRRPYDGNNPGHSLFEVLGRRSIYSRRQLLANAAIAASRVGWILGAAASERQYLASLRNLLATDYAATYLDASFVAVIAARRWNVGWMRGISGSARWSRCHNRFESSGLDH